MKRLGMLVSAFLVLFVGGCFEDIDEAPLVLPSETVPAPHGLAARVGDRTVTLSWEPVEGAVGYRVYRSVDVSGNGSLLASPADTFCVDADVQNGRSYFYSVSTVGAQRLEGERSAEIMASPALFGVMIEGGAVYTGSRSVTLRITAPATTALMMIANTPSLSGGRWESFSAARSWQLGGGEGPNAVYAKMRDASGAESPIVGDTISLDTFARITDIAITPVMAAYAPASVAHFALEVEGNEAGGTAIVGFGGSTETVTLSDDGDGGDRTAGDGVYETDYRFPSSLRGVDIIVAGAFTDRVGNEAPLFESPERISFTDPPEAVKLLGAVDSTISDITIRWVPSHEEHFQCYRLYRDTKTGVTENPSLLVRQLYNIDQSSYPDGELSEGVRYYYRIFVVNDLGESAGSNEVVANTYNAYPDPVLLDNPTSVGGGRATLTWSVNPNTDWREYRLYRSTQPGVTLSSVLVTTITDRERTFFDDSGLDLGGNTYYYRVYVFDLSGKNSRSNEVDTAP